ALPEAVRSVEGVLPGGWWRCPQSGARARTSVHTASRSWGSFVRRERRIDRQMAGIAASSSRANTITPAHTYVLAVAPAGSAASVLASSCSVGSSDPSPAVWVASSDSSSLGLADSDFSLESFFCLSLARVHSGGSPAGPPGVGSKRTQPAPSK